MGSIAEAASLYHADAAGSLNIKEADLEKEFETLVSTGKIIYDTSQKHIAYTAGPRKFPFHFCVTTAFDDKPQFGTSTPEDQDPNDFLPGSDINIKGYEVTKVLERGREPHVLAWNKFAMFKPHLMLLTLDGHKRQDAPLELDNIHALWRVIAALQDQHDWLGFFNCGKDGGCSRTHKHMQLFPLRKEDDFQMFPDTDAVKTDTPFRYYLHRFADSAESPQDEIFNAYLELLAKAKKEMGVDSTDPAAHFPHNMIMSKRWIVVIPRRMNRYEGLGLNAAGMMGLVGLPSEEYEKWLKVGPEKVLAESGVER